MTTQARILAYLESLGLTKPAPPPVTATEGEPLSIAELRKLLGSDGSGDGAATFTNEGTILEN